MQKLSGRSKGKINIQHGVHSFTTHRSRGTTFAGRMRDSSIRQKVSAHMGFHSLITCCSTGDTLRRSSTSPNFTVFNQGDIVTTGCSLPPWSSTTMAKRRMATWGATVPVWQAKSYKFDVFVARYDVPFLLKLASDVCQLLLLHLLFQPGQGTPCRCAQQNNRQLESTVGQAAFKMLRWQGGSSCATSEGWRYISYDKW